MVMHHLRSNCSDTGALGTHFYKGNMVVYTRICSNQAFRGMSAAAGTHLIPGWAWSLVPYEDLMISAQTISSCVHLAFRWKLLLSKEETKTHFYNPSGMLKRKVVGFCCEYSYFFLESVVVDCSVLKTEVIYAHKLEKDWIWGPRKRETWEFFPFHTMLAIL